MADDKLMKAWADMFADYTTCVTKLIYAEREVAVLTIERNRIVGIAVQALAYFAGHPDTDETMHEVAANALGELAPFCPKKDGEQ